MSDATIAQIQANIEYDFNVERGIAERSNQSNDAVSDFLDNEQEEEQLDDAVATLDPIDQLRQQREQERLEQERIKFAQSQEDRIIRLQKQAAKGNEQATLELEKIKKQQAKDTGRIGTIATDAASGIHDQVQQTTDRAVAVANDAWQGVGRIAIPGSIWLPVTILLIFFFLLLPVNGMTRAQWLFAALLGDAHVEPGGGGLGSGGGGVKTFTGVSNI